jgi:hypothetical protein
MVGHVVGDLVGDQVGEVLDEVVGRTGRAVEFTASRGA